MPKYLLQASYTAEGAQGILKDGGSKRRQAVEELLKSMNGKIGLNRTGIFGDWIH